MSIISPSRRKLLTKIVATGVGGAIFSTFDAGEADAQLVGNPADLLQAVSFMNENIAENRTSAQEWLAGSEIIKATKNEFDSPIQAEWASDFSLRNERGFLKTNARFQSDTEQCQMGVSFHPLMSIIGYRPNLTLNIFEIKSLYTATTAYNNNIGLYSNDRMVLAPFPDTARLEIQPLYEDTFVRIVLMHNDDPNKYRLYYARFYVMCVATSTGKRKPQPILAHAYGLRNITNIKEDVRISYTLI
jgi:hypothetical protein